MLERLKDMLVTLRLLDPDRTVSLTSIVLMAATFKFIVTPSCDTETLIALLGAIASFQAKKVINGRTANEKHAKNLARVGELLEDASRRIVVLENRVGPVGTVRR